MVKIPVRLSIEEVDKMIAEIEARGGDAEELKRRRAEVADTKWLAAHPKPPGEEEYLETMRQQAVIERGKDLECMICHDKFDLLLSGTCEACFKGWMLSARPKG